MYLSRSLICLDQVFVVELSPSEDVTPVAKVIRTVGETIPKIKKK